MVGQRCRSEEGRGMEKSEMIFYHALSLSLSLSLTTSTYSPPDQPSPGLKFCRDSHQIQIVGFSLDDSSRKAQIPIRTDSGRVVAFRGPVAFLPDVTAPIDGASYGQCSFRLHRLLL